MATINPIHVIGGGLAGSEAAWQIAEAGVPVILHEMRPERMTEAHKTGGFAELVCSNSFRSDEWETNAVGLLHEEMRRCGSLIMAAGDAHKLPAGGALAVDRDGFSAEVTERISAHPLITLERGEVAGLPPEDWDSVIIATGPLTSPALGSAIQALTGEDSLAFFDAIAPIVHRESVDMDICWMQSRYDKTGPSGTGADYINCPMDRDAIWRLHRGAAGGGKDRVPRMGARYALFRGLPADRGHGGTRRGDAALRADEAGRPHQPAQPASPPLCGGAIAPGQCARHAVEHGRLSDQAEIWRAVAHLPDDPRPGRRRNSRASAASIATPSSTARSCSIRSCG